MSARARRRRALLTLSLALACGGLAASEVRGRAQEVERQVGPLVPVLVAAREVAPDAELRGRDLVLRRVPERFAPRDSLSVVRDALGLRSAVPLAAGSYLTAGQLRGGKGGAGQGGASRRGERAVEIAVAGAQALSEGAAPGARVDVIVSTEPRQGGARTFLALEDVELLGLRPAEGASAGGGEEGRPTASALATLRVTLRQAVYLTAAQNFAREVRLLPRPPGDGSRLGRAAIGAGDL